MIASVPLADVITVEIPDAPLPDDAADLIARWLLDLADRRTGEDGDAAQHRRPEITGTGVGP